MRGDDSSRFLKTKTVSRVRRPCWTLSMCFLSKTPPNAAAAAAAGAELTSSEAGPGHGLSRSNQRQKERKKNQY